MKKLINVYEVTREYGGPEEGGWYYDWYKCVETFTVDKRTNLKSTYRKAQRIQDEFNADYAYGDISSVNGGVEYWATVESLPGESESKERPYYC